MVTQGIPPGRQLQHGDRKLRWDTSDHCFTSDAGTTVHINENVEILCSGYDDNEQSYFFISINGEYDGENTITGYMYAEECGADDEPVVLTR